MPELEAAAARLRLALDLFETGVGLMRQRLRRERPDATSAEIETALRAWLAAGPEAEHGDAAGTAGQRRAS